MVEDSQRRPDRNRRAPEAHARGGSAPNIILITRGCYLDEWPWRFSGQNFENKRNVSRRGRRNLPVRAIVTRIIFRLIGTLVDARGFRAALFYTYHCITHLRRAIIFVAEGYLVSIDVRGRHNVKN